MSDQPVDSEQVAPQVIDLDAARAAREEARGGKPRQVKVGEKLYDIPSEIPAAIIGEVGLLQGGELGGIETVFAALFGPGTWVSLKSEADLSLDDLMFLLDHVLGSYGITLPESSASAPSS